MSWSWQPNYNHESFDGVKTTEIFEANNDIYLNVGNDAAGDIHHRGSDGKLKRVAIGVTGQVLGVTAPGQLGYIDQLNITDGTNVNQYLGWNGSGYIPRQINYSEIAGTPPIDYPVTSVFGRTGNIAAQIGDYTTNQVTEDTNLYFTTLRARQSISNTGPISYNSGTGVIGWNGTTTDVPEGTNLYYTDSRADARITAQKGQPNGLASLDGAGKLPVSQLPSIAITDTYVVNSQAAMLALVADTGDVAIRTDESKTYILKGSDPTVLANWEEVLNPLGYVSSVNATIGGALNVSGGPITSSGTLAFSWTGIAAQYVKGNGTLATFPTAVSAFTNDAGYLTANQTITLTGDVTGSGITTIATTIQDNTISTNKIINSAVTWNKIQDVPGAGYLVGRSGTSVGSGPVTAIQMVTGFSWSGNTVSVADNTTIQKVSVYSTGTFVASRKGINFIPGTNVGSVVVADNNAQDRVDITINAAATPNLQAVTNAGKTTTLDITALQFISTSDVSFQYQPSQAYGWEIVQRQPHKSTPLPAAAFRPTVSNTAVNFTVMPNGTASDYSDNGIAFIDVMDADVKTSTVAASAARVGITSQYVQFGARSFNGAFLKPIQMVMGTTVMEQYQTDTFTKYFFGKRHYQQTSVIGDFVGGYILNTDNTTAHSDAIFYVGNDIASGRFGFIRWSNAAQPSDNYRNPNQLEIFATNGATNGMAFGTLAANAPIKFYTDNGFAIHELARMTNNGYYGTGVAFGVGVSSPTAILHLRAGTTSARTAPLKINPGVLMAATEPGAIEVTNTHIYWTDNAGVRWQLDQQSTGGSGTVTSFSFTNANGFTGTVNTPTISPNLTIDLQDAVADGATKGKATFAANDFNSSSGLITIDYTNGQAASSTQKGFLTSANWTTFNNKLSQGVNSLNQELVLNGSTTNAIRLINSTYFELNGDVRFTNLSGIDGNVLLGKSTVNGSVTNISLASSLLLSSNSLKVNPAGSNTQVQFNNAGSLGASSNYTWDNSARIMQATGSVYAIDTLTNITSGTTRLFANTTMNWNSNLGQAGGAVFTAANLVVTNTFNTNYTINAGSPFTSAFTWARLDASNNANVTIQQAGQGRRTLSANLIMVQLLGNDNTSTSVISHVSGFQIAPIISESAAFIPRLGITNYYAFLIGDQNEYGNVTARITNRYAFWQEGNTDLNVFKGKTAFHNIFTEGSAITSQVDIWASNGFAQLRLRTTYTPANSADGNGNTGDVAWDDNFVYMKTSVGWKRAALSAF